MSVPQGVSDVAGFLLLPAFAWAVSSLIVAWLMPARRDIALRGALISGVVAAAFYLLWMVNTN